MSIAPSFSLAESLLQLCFKRDGRLHGGLMLNQILTAGVLAELILNGAIEVDQNSRKKLVSVCARDEQSQGLADPSLLIAYEAIASSKSSRGLQSWLSRFASKSELRNSVVNSLVKKGIVEERREKILGFIPYRRLKLIDPTPAQEICERLQSLIVATQAESAPEVILLSLSKNTGLLKKLFSSSFIKQNQQRIDKLTKGELTGEAVQSVIAAVQAAVIVATVIPAVVVATS